MLRQVALPDGLTKGSLYLCSMPGRYEALEIFLNQASVNNVEHILCLVSDEEIAEKSQDYSNALKQNAIPMQILRYPIADYQEAKDTVGLRRTLDGVRDLLDSGKHVVIHCAAGHGRTGMISTILLARMGLPLDQALEIIDDAGSACDTSEQRGFVEGFVGQSI